MSDLVTGVVIVRERCAKTDPPEHEWDVLTDRGFAYHGNGSWWRLDPNTCRDVRVAPQPSVWFDFPRDTERERLTVSDLSAAVNALAVLAGQMKTLGFADHETAAGLGSILARLRAAIEALDTKGAGGE